MLGTALRAQAPPGVETVAVDLEEGDLSLAGVAERLVAQHRPATVIHCAAWADVDGCTRDPDRAMRHNAHATELLAAACVAHGARLVYISTDYVFAGDAGRPYREMDAPRPLSVYGQSKLSGEGAAAAVPDHLIVRTQWLYGPAGRNFVATIVNAARARAELKVVADEFGSPTYTADLAPALWEAANTGVTGTLHLTGSGVCSWFQLARHAIEVAGLRTVLHPVSSADWGSSTRRPKFSPLSNGRCRSLGLPALRPWPEAVREYVTTHLGDASSGED
jgi:dTDP-4-dehydrorhamnose reductase